VLNLAVLTGGRVRRIAAPLLVLAAAAAGTVYVAEIDPGQPGHYPLCPFRALTGCYCPGCGTLRAIHALGHGHLASALGFNALTVCTLPLLGYLWARWAVRGVTGRPPGRPAHPAWLWGFLAVVIVFWVARNLPFGHVLAPTGRFPAL
jgi:Protein of unknown function (DUF2752)